MSTRPHPKGRIRTHAGEKWQNAQQAMFERNRPAHEKRMLARARNREANIKRSALQKAKRKALQKAGEEDLLGPRFRNG